MITAIRKRLWNITTAFYPLYLRQLYGMDVARTAVISHKSKLDKSINPKGIHIGEYTWILANAVILSHDHSRNLITDTFVGNHCIIGINSIVLPGIKIGDHSVVGSGSVVTKDVPAHCIVAGNPARIIRKNISVNDRGQII